MRRKMNPKRLNISNGMRINAGKTKQSGPCIVVQGIVILIISILCTVGIMQTDLHATNKVATSNTHTLAITTLNTVNCTGENATGECDVSSWVDIEQVAAGSFFSVALDVTGNVYCTGGMPFISDPCSESNSTFSGKTIVYIAAGETHIIGIDDNGKAYAVGGNNSGQTDISGWPSTIIQVDGGKEHTLGLKSDNKVVCAGSNTRNQCNVSSWTGITQISAGSFFSLGLKTGGTVEFAGWDNQNQASTISGWMNVKHISAGYDHSVAVTNANEPLAVGANEQGQCNTSNWTVIDDVVAGTTCTIGVLETGELTVIGDTESEVNDTEGWQLINNPPSPYTQASISAYEDYTAGPTCDLLNHANTTDLESDAEGKPISYYGTDLTASNGTVTYNGDSTFSYTPIADFNGSDSFTYTLTDGEAINPTGTASVSVWITPVNDPPYYSDFNSYSAIYFNYPATCLYDFDSIDLAGKAIKFSFWFNIPQTNSSDFQIHLTTDSGYFATNFRDSTSHHLTFFGNDTSITISENVWYKAVLLNENEVASFTLYDSNLNELSSKTRSHSYTNCCRIRVGASGGDSNLWQIIFDQLTLEVTETIDDVDVKYRKYFIDSTEWDNDFKNGSGGSFSLVDGLTEPNYMLDTVTEDAGPQSISAWARDLTAGAYNEGAQSLSITWTCSDESLFLTAPVISPVTSLSSDLTLTYAYKDDEYGPVTLTVVLYDDGGLDHLAYGAADRITRTYVIEALSVNDPPTFTFLRGTHITLLENSRIHTHAGAHSYTDWATSVYEGAIHETGQTLSFDVSNNNTGLFSIPPDMAVVSDTSYTRGELTFTLNADVSGDVTVTVILEDTGGTANSGVYQVTQTFTITILPDTDHDGPGGIGDTTGLAALKLWLKADSFTDLSDGATLTTWFDNTDNGYTCTQSGSPQYVENFSNDFPAVEFDGSNYFEYNASSLDFLNSTGISIFAVVNATTSSVTNTIIARDASGNHSWACQLDPSNKLLFSVANSSSQACTRLGAASISSNYTIVSFQYDGLVDESLQVYAGETDDSDSLGYTIPYYINGSGPALRIGNDGNGNNFVGQIAELIVFNRALGDVERVLINNYLSAKYDIALSANDKYTGDNVSAGDFDRDVAGIGLESDDSINAHAISAGMIVTSTGFVQDAGDYLLFGHNNEASPLTLTNLPFNVKSACERVWMFHKTDQSTNGGDIDIAFDLNELELSDLTLTTDFLLLRRSGSVGTFEIFNSSPTVLNNQIIFTVDTADLNTGDCLTFGSEIDYMLDFSGASDYLVSEKSVDLTNTSFTIEYWERRFSSTEMYIIGQGQNLIAGFAAANVIKFGFSDTNFVQSQGAPVDDLTNWHHHAYVYDKVTRNIQIYVDGKSVPLTSNTMTDDYTGTGVLYVGMAPSSSFKFNAYLDDVRIWSTVRTQTEIIENMNKYMDGDETNLLANWQFNEGASNITYDKTTAAIDLCLTPTNNEPTWIISDLPLGYTSASYTEQNGTLSFTDTGMTMDYNYHNGATVVVTKVVTEPASLPGGDDDLSAQYWIVTRNSDSTFNAKLTFEIDEFFNMPTQDYPEKVAKLYWREIGSQGAWEEIAYGFEINAPDSVKFESIKTSGQFMVSLDDFEPIAGSGKSLGFDGMDDCAFDETCRIDLTNTNFTIEFWAKRAIYDQTNIIIAQNDTAQGLSIGFTATNAFIFSVGSDIASTNAYTELGWHHWAVSFDNSNYTQTIYCDGEWITENTASASYDLTGIFYVGCGASQTNNYMGQLDDIRVWRTVRTQEEIQNNMFVPIQEDDEPFDLFVYWRLDDTWSYKYFSDAIKARSVNLEVTGSVQATNMWDSEAWMKRISDEDVSVTIVAGYDLEDGLDFTIYSKGMPSNGTITSDTPYIHYTPNEHYPDQVDSNIDNFMYRLFSVSGDTFLVEFTILQVNDPPEIGDIDPTITGTNESVSVSFTITDIETDADSLLITATSNDYTLVSDSNISLTCSSGNCTMTITPTANEYGTLTINFIIEDPEGLTGINAMALTINSYPEIGSIEDYTVTAFTATAAIPFTIADTETATEELSLTITSDPEIFDSSNASFSPLTPATNNTVTLTPTTNSYTVVSVSVIVTDAASYTAASTFDLYIKTLPEIEPISDYTTAVNIAQSISFKITDLDTGADSLELTITTSDTNILPLTATSYTNSSGDCTATFTPTAYGSVDITITVGDIDSNYTSTTFILNSVMSPEISSINDYTISQNTEIPSFNFTVSDETNASQLTVTFTSSDESIIPSAQIVEANDGIDSYTLTITPLANQTGTVTITILAVDSDLYTGTHSFTINIVSLPGSGNMLTFDGSSDYAKSGDTLSLSGDHTVEAWIKPGSASLGGIITVGDSDFSKILFTDSREIAVDILIDGGHYKNYTGTTQLTLDKWYHVTYTFDSNSNALTIYVNGISEIVTVSEAMSISPFSLSAAPVFIGKDQDTSYFDGSIDEVRIWNDVRTEEEIRDFMCEKAYTSTTDDLVAYYRFDHDNGTNLMYDWTGSGNSCELTGATLATSEATIGDDSVHDYGGTSLSLAHSDGDNFTMTICSGGPPDGIHVYIVNSTPNSTYVNTGVIKTNRYWGVFITGSYSDYDLLYEYTQNPYAVITPSENALAWRDNNADDTWDDYNSTADDGDGLIDTTGLISSNTKNYEFILLDTSP
jgi:alpha-tubulin suppressor-like RCC1 family protein